MPVMTIFKLFMSAGERWEDKNTTTDNFRKISLQINIV